MHIPNKSGVQAELSPEADNALLAMPEGDTKDAIVALLNGDLRDYAEPRPTGYLPEDDEAPPLVLERLGEHEGEELTRVNGYVIFHQELTDRERKALGRPAVPRPPLADHWVSTVLSLSQAAGARLGADPYHIVLQSLRQAIDEAFADPSEATPSPHPAIRVYLDTLSTGSLVKWDEAAIPEISDAQTLVSRTIRRMLGRALSDAYPERLSSRSHLARPEEPQQDELTDKIPQEALVYWQERIQRLLKERQELEPPGSSQEGRQLDNPIDPAP
jgi:hypothetical protein